MGLPNVTTFSPVTEQWTSFTPMQRGRWYPTTTVMGNGDVVILAGRDEEVWREISSFLESARHTAEQDAPL